MKNLRTKLSYALYTLLVAGVLTSCDINEGALGWHNQVNPDGLKTLTELLKLKGVNILCMMLVTLIKVMVF